MEWPDDHAYSRKRAKVQEFSTYRRNRKCQCFLQQPIKWDQVEQTGVSGIPSILLIFYFLNSAKIYRVCIFVTSNQRNDEGGKPLLASGRGPVKQRINMLGNIWNIGA